MFSTHQIKNHLFLGIRNWWWARRLARFPSTRDGKRLLHIGCGAINSPEFINLDARPMPHVHIVSKNIFDLRMIPDASLDLIYMSHVLEHVPRNKVAQTTKEMGRVLKAGGTLRISVPNFDHIVGMYQQSGSDISLIAPPLMGGQDYAFNFHYSIFNERSLTAILESASFTNIRMWDPQNCEHHDFEDWASRDIHYRGSQFPISLNLEATRNPT